MLVRQGLILSLLKKIVTHSHRKATQDVTTAIRLYCSNRKLSDGFHPTYFKRYMYIPLVAQTRSITWSQLLAHTEKTDQNSSKSSPQSEVESQSKNGRNSVDVEGEPKIEAPPAPAAILASTEGDNQTKAKEAKALKPKRIRVDLSKSSLERNFITPVQAMSDFLLKPPDLEGLRKTKRRSPYENEPPITVYWRKDVESRANEVWGSRERLLNELAKRDMENRQYQQNVFSVKRQLRDYLRMHERDVSKEEAVARESGLFGSSGRVVLTAVVINGCNFIFKLSAWLYTGSHSMFAESVHSLADTINQVILAYGIYKSTQQADVEHPYGYSNMRYVASLISGVGIFCVGTGLSLYHGVQGLVNPAPLDNFYWAFYILGGSLLSEGATLVMACNAIRKGASNHNMSFTEYIMRGQDPSVNVVLLEDLAAVVGVGVCITCMGLTHYYGSHIPDAFGSILVGVILGAVAKFIIMSNIAGLVGRSIPHDQLEKINAELEEDVMVRAIHDVKGIDMGNFLVRYKAEIDFDGRELTRSYLDKQDVHLMLEEVKSFKDIDELESFMVKHGENVVDMMGAEIDRIEVKLRKKHPEIRHCDLEIL